MGVQVPGVLGVGMASGPHFRLEVLDVEILIGADGAHRIDLTIGVAPGMQLFAHDDVIAGRVNAALVLGRQDGQQALFTHVGGDGQPGALQESRCQIGQGDEIANPPSPFEVLAPGDGQRQARAIVIEVGLGAREGHAVVGGNDDEGVVQLARLLQEGQYLADLAVKPFDGVVVVEQVAAYSLRIGQERRYLHFAQFFAGSQPHAFRQRPVRLGSAQKEEEGLLLILLVVKFHKISGVMDAVDARRHAVLPQ